MKILKYYNSSAFIFICLVLGVLSGIYIPDFIVELKPIGDIFIQLIKMMVLPIILMSVLISISEIGDGAGAASLGLGILLYFFLASCIAGGWGIVVGNVLHPGIGDLHIPKSFFVLTPEMKQSVESMSTPTLLSFLQGIVPSNVFNALDTSNLIQVLFFIIFFGMALAYNQNSQKDKFILLLEICNESFMWMMSKVMYLAPIAVFLLMAYFVHTLGTQVIWMLAKVMLSIIVGLFIWVYVILGIVLVFIAKVPYFKFMKELIPVKLMAISTSSSLVTLPTHLISCEKLNLKPAVYRLVVPLGANLHMNGSAVYYAILTLFFAQMFGVHLGWYEYILICITASLGSMATPGIPGLSMTVLLVMMVAHVPIIGLPLIFAIDRVLDMFITLTNIVGNTVCSAVLSRFVKDR